MLKKRILLIVVSTLLLLVAVGLAYRYWYQTPETDAWSLVPNNALVVYETDDFPAHWSHLTQSPLWNILQDVPDVRRLGQRLNYLDSLINLESLLSGRPLLTAVHVVGSDAIDATFFVKLSGSGALGRLQKALDQLQQAADLQPDQRQYDGYTIYELKDSSTDQVFSYILYEQTLVGSFTPFLVEDVVRNIADGLQHPFVVANPTLMRLPKLTDDEGNLYVNATELATLLSVFVNQKTVQLEALSAFSQAMLLDVNVETQEVLFNGFSATASSAGEGDSVKLPDYLQTFKHQNPQPLRMATYIPNRTALLYHITFDQGASWQESLYAFQQAQPLPEYEEVVRKRKQLAQQYSVLLPAWYDWLAGEIGLLTLESVDAEHPDRALLMAVTDTSRAHQALRTLAGKVKPEADSLYEEKYGAYTISEITLPELPTLLIGPAAQGFRQCFYLVTDQYVVMANSVRTLKRLMQDREAENTWSKSLKQSRFLDSTVDEANISLIVDMARAWNIVAPRLAPKWANWATPWISRFEKIAIQFNQSDEVFYTSIAAYYDSSAVEEKKDTPFITLAQVSADQPIRTKPFVVRRANSPALQVLFQDQANQLYLISSDNTIQWADSLTQPIVSDVYSVLDSDNRQQYIFATDSTLYALNDNGSVLPSYPLRMPNTARIQYFSPIDYDNTQQHRWLVATPAGNLWMFDQEGNALDGWNPNPLSGPLAAPPSHVRVRGKDCLIALQQDGTVHVKNRRGEPYPGFPLALDQPCHSPLFIEPASDFEETTLTTVTDRGELISFNLRGNIVRRTQLYRPSTGARFALSEDALSKTFVIIRQDEATLGVLNREGVLLFEKSFFSPDALASGQLMVQYYNFGANHEVIAITDQVQAFTYLFTPVGELINARPLESDFPIGLLYLEDADAFRIYRTFEKEFAIMSFR